MAYSVRTDVETLFGANNVTKWADLDNDGDGPTITARITAAIVKADDFIDSFMRDGPYDLPLEDDATATPVMITDISARIAGTVLFSARGVIDTDAEGDPVDRMQWHREHATELLQLLKDRVLNLDVAAKLIPRTVPTVVKETTTTP